MNNDKILTYKELIDAVNADKVARIESAQKFDLICRTLERFDPSKVKELEEKCNYRITKLKNSEDHINSAFKDEVAADKAVDSRFLSESKEALSDSIAELEDIKKAVNFAFDEAVLDNYSKSIVSNVDDVLKEANKCLSLSVDALNGKFKDVEEKDEKENDIVMPEVKEEIKEEVKEEIKDEVQEEVKEEANEVTAPAETNVFKFEPANVQTFEFENIERDLNNDIKPIQEDQDMLKEYDAELNNNKADLVTATEDVKAPFLMPAETKSLADTIDSMQKESEQEIAPVTEFAQTAEVVPFKQVESAASVDDGFVLVTKQEKFGFGNVDSTVTEEEEKTLSRAA